MPLDTATAHQALVVIAHAVLAAVGVWLIVIDARTHRLPNRIVLPALGGALALVVFEAMIVHDASRLIRALLALLLLGGFFLLLRIVSRGGMGGGDVKLAALLGVVLGWHGWEAVVLGAASAFLLGALYALVLMALRRATAKTRIAFGPWMIAGAAVAILAV